MEEVMYGVILNANTDMFVNEPPVIVLKKPNASLDCLVNSSWKNVVLTPGIGSCDPSHNQHKERIEEFFSDLFYLKCILERF